MDPSRVAYFSMEIALDPGMPTYAGGLGVLAGDTLRAAADAKLPLVAVSLVHRQGHFRQRIDDEGHQREEPVPWPLQEHLEDTGVRVAVSVERRTVRVRAWKYLVRGQTGGVVTVYLLDTDFPENDPRDRVLTHWLYGGDMRYRLGQEVVLGIGGVRALRALGHDAIERFHMNEGHSSLLTLELLDERARAAGRERLARADVEAVRRQCIFTTHTPVPAGHDQFPMDLMLEVLGRLEVQEMSDVFCCEGRLNLTFLALNLSHYVNGVAKRHGQLAQHMLGRPVDAITNGVHAPTWASPAFARLFDRHIPGWQDDNFSLRRALRIPAAELWDVHREQKEALIRYVNGKSRLALDPNAFTIGYARRMTSYKRPGLLLTDRERLARISTEVGAIQIVYAGKAHPQDARGKELIRVVNEAARTPFAAVKIAFLEDYDLNLAKLLTSGVDLWINTPEPPLEASGTSGMKAALNGVPSLSILDGWWLEGCIEGFTGWSIGGDSEGADMSKTDRSVEDAKFLYDKLEHIVAPMFYRSRDAYIDVMRHSIALNAAFFNAQRMLQQYLARAYRL